MAPAALPAEEGGWFAWGIDSCAFVIAAVPVDEAALAARLPAGFGLAPGRLAPLPAGPRATVELDAYACEEGAWGNATLRGLAYGSHYASVILPDALRDPGYDAAFVKWDTLVADADARAALARAGAPAHGGDARVSIASPTVRAALAFDDGGGFALTGTLGAQRAQETPLPFVEYTPLAEGGLARWHARLHDARIATGAGIVELPEGSWVRDLAGAPRVPVTFIAGAWSLDEADVAWPIAWP